VKPWGREVDGGNCSRLQTTVAPEGNTFAEDFRTEVFCTQVHQKELLDEGLAIKANLVLKVF